MCVIMLNFQFYNLLHISFNKQQVIFSLLIKILNPLFVVGEMRSLGSYYRTTATQKW